MDYKEKYNQAIKRAKAMIKVANNQEETYNSVITIFPELADSEDERVRKELINYVIGANKYGSNKKFESWIAWLKKQSDANKEYWRGYREGKKEILDKYSKLEKQGEQKPAWNEEDYNEIESIACHLDNTDNKGMAEVLRNIRDKYYIPQSTWKPSDEQMDMLAKVCSTLHLTSGENEIMESIYDALKKLKGEEI